ncbi:ArsR/SmtB family transcription factor [Streptomyces sp. NPDC093568]|uniref:ArsR/SmtB family transcription factor n=1 Tax=Streptomyces sp. NPDC093568 TaxID=3366041 RepID=UPI003816CA70
MPSDVFSALANPVRRRLLDALREGPRAVNDLAGRFELSRPAISEHLQVLRQARLVREEPRGRQRFYHLEPTPLAEVSEWLHPFEHYWRARMRSLRDLLDEEELAEQGLDANQTDQISKDTPP